MELEEFVKELRRLRRKLNMYRDLYSQNEAAVKLQIINPLLRMLGWDLEDPKQVIPEFPFR
jgi:predicted type IV restriction endonuclease